MLSTAQSLYVAFLDGIKKSYTGTVIPAVFDRIWNQWAQVEWLKNNVVDNFVIIDDKTSDIERHINNVVKCRSWIGLSQDEYKEIEIILNESNL